MQAEAAGPTCVEENTSQHRLTSTDEAALYRNLRSVQRRVGPSVRIMAVLKQSIEYTLPAAPAVLARYYESLPRPPAAYGLACVADALAVRGVVPQKLILVLYPVEVELVPILWAKGIDVAISSVSWVRRAAEALRQLHGHNSCGRRLGVHVFVDTGHARSGASPRDALSILASVLRHGEWLEARGAMSQFCCNLRMDGPPARDIMRLWGIGDLGSAWPEERLQREALRMHALQKQRVAAVFDRLDARLGRHAMREPSGSRPRMIRHVASSNAVANAEAETYYDMVRVGAALFRGVAWSSSAMPWSRQLTRRCLVDLLGGCDDRVRVQAVKTVPAARDSEWCLSYACLAAPRGEDLPFRVDAPLRLATLSGVCHEEAGPYVDVWLPAGSGLHMPLEAIGDGYGRVVIVPLASDLNTSSDVFLRPPALWQQRAVPP